MRVLITQQIYAALPILAKLPFQMKEIHKYQTDKKLNLDKFKVEDLEKLVKQTAKAPNDITRILCWRLVSYNQQRGLS